MRIAQISPPFESVPPKLYGGTERVVDCLTRGLVAHGHEVTVFCSGDSTTPGRIEPIWPEALRLSKRRIVDTFAYLFRTLELVARRAHEFDVIHSHCDYAMLPLSRMTDVPLVTTLHSRLDQPDLPAVLDCFSDLPFVSISDAQRRPLSQLRWQATVHHGIDLDALAFNPRPRGGYLAYLGRFSPEKRPDWALDIADLCGIPLKIAAKIDEANPAYFERLIRPRLDGKRIEYLGEIAEHEKSEFLGNALALVNPIDWPEPFGLVMVEAMACGTPVLTRPVGSVPELMRDGVTGFVRGELSELARLAPLAASLDRQRIRRYVEERFSIERMTREYLNVYRELIARNEQARRDQPRGQRTHPWRVGHDRRHLIHSLDGPAERDREGVA